MIKSDSKISEKIRLSLDKFEKLEYESRSIVRTSVFEEQEAKFVESLRKPLNILKAGCWRKVKCNGVKERVWSRVAPHSQNQIGADLKKTIFALFWLKNPST